MRLLFIALLSAIGFVASAPEPRVAHHSIAQVVHPVAQEHGIAGHAAEHALPTCVPAQAVALAKRTLAPQSSGGDLTAGLGGALGAWEQNHTHEFLTTRDTPAVGTATRRRQPEGRASPNGPTAA